MQVPRIVHMGSAIVDLTYEIEHLPERATEVQARHAQIAVGGAFNAMSAARANGVAVAYGGRHGSGQFGDMVRNRLTDVGIELLQSPTLHGDTGTCVVLVDATAERTFVTHCGVESVLNHEDLRCLIPTPTDHVVLSGYTLAYPGSRDALAEWVDALDPRCTVVFDPGPVVAAIPREILQRVLLRTHWLSCNAREAFLLSGERDPQRALRALQTRSYPVMRGLLVRLGAQGCLVAATGQPVTHLAGLSVDAVDTNGAGDTHLGNFVAVLCHGEQALEAARYANAAAAYAVTRRGGAVAPDRTAVGAFLDSHSNK
jgi:sugar/nucleoside kinase (ribokinase family)